MFDFLTAEIYRCYISLAKLCLFTSNTKKKKKKII